MKGEAFQRNRWPPHSPSCVVLVWHSPSNLLTLSNSNPVQPECAAPSNLFRTMFEQQSNTLCGFALSWYNGVKSVSLSTEQLQISALVDDCSPVHASWSLVPTMQSTASCTEITVSSTRNHNRTYLKFQINLKYSKQSASSTLSTPFLVRPAWAFDIACSNPLFTSNSIIPSTLVESRNVRGSLLHSLDRSHVLGAN